MAEHTYLDGILEWHRARAAADRRSLVDLIEQARHVVPPRGFARTVSGSPHLAVIAEIKRRSPSKGDLNPALDPAVIAQQYQAGGASCLSVLTDSVHFGGSVDDLQAARAACDLPVLRKDFTVDARDVCDARLMGADCVLLIATALSALELSEFLDVAEQVDIDVLVEVHEEVDLATAINAGARLVGVNQRNLVTFAVDHERAVRMASHIPSNIVKVAESGVRGRDDALALRTAGYDAVLVGEHLVTAPDRSRAVTELLVD